jgi:ATP-dependent Lon protease
LVEKVTLPGKDEEVPALFSREIVLFPRMQISLVLGEERGKGAISQSLRENHLIAFIPSDFEKERQGIGVLTLVVSSEQTLKGLRVDLRGLWRVRVKSAFGLSSGPSVKVEKLDEVEEPRRSETQSMKRVHAQLDEFRKLIPDIPEEITSMLASASNASELSDLCAMSPTLTHDERLQLLETLDPEQRLEQLSRHFDRELETLKSMVDAKPIPECEICADLADKAFDADQTGRAEAIVELLNHMVGTHTAELLNVLAEKYGPSFMKRRSLR